MYLPTGYSLVDILSVNKSHLYWYCAYIRLLTDRYPFTCFNRYEAVDIQYN